MSEFNPEDHYSEKVGQVYDAAAVSRNPLSTEIIFDMAAEYGVNEDSLVLDVGCANGGNTRKLQARTGCTIEGIDYVNVLVEMGQAENKAAGVEDKIHIQQGSILHLPFPDDHFDFVFCRDTLSVIEDLPLAVTECHRVLKPGKFMLAYVVQATKHLDVEESAEFRDYLGCFSLDEKSMQDRLTEKFRLEKKIVLGSQGVQQRIESGDDEAPQRLLKIARLITWKDDYIAEHGEKNYYIALADLKWQVYMLLGKLQGIIYVSQKA